MHGWLESAGRTAEKDGEVGDCEMSGMGRLDLGLGSDKEGENCIPVSGARASIPPSHRDDRERGKESDFHQAGPNVITDGIPACQTLSHIEQLT